MVAERWVRQHVWTLRHWEAQRPHLGMAVWVFAVCHQGLAV